MVPTSVRLNGESALCMAKVLRTVVAASVKEKMGAEVRGVKRIKKDKEAIKDKG